MPKYSVAINVYSTMYVDVEANSEEEAKNKVGREACEPSLCWQCAKELDIDGLGEVVSVELVKP